MEPQAWGYYSSGGILVEEIYTRDNENGCGVPETDQNGIIYIYISDISFNGTLL